MLSPKCIVPSADICGEAVVWSQDEQAVYWCDINRFLIHRLDIQTDDVRTWIFDEPVTAIGLTNQEGTLIIAIAGRIAFFDTLWGDMSDFADTGTSFPHARLNDGRPDPFGGFVVGSMANNVNPETGEPMEFPGTQVGELFHISPHGELSVLKKNIGISNTVCWSPNRQIFYSADSAQNAIFAWSCDEKTGQISSEWPFFIGFDRGLPDGSAVDSEGYIWNARYGGGCIVRISPLGIVDQVVEMPVAAPTTCTFGGPDLKTLYVTSSAAGAKGYERFGGGLFALETDVPGLPENTFIMPE